MSKYIAVILLLISLVSPVGAYQSIDGNTPFIATPTTYTVITFPANYQNDALSQDWMKVFSSNQTLLYLRSITECKTYTTSDPDWQTRWYGWIDGVPSIVIVQDGNLVYNRSGVSAEIIAKELEQGQFLQRIRPCPPNQPCPVNPYGPYGPTVNPQQPQPYLPDNRYPLNPTTPNIQPDPVFPAPVPIPQTPLPTPVVPDKDELDEYIKVNDDKVKDLESRVASLEETKKNVLNDLKKIKVEVPGMLDAAAKKLEGELNKIKEAAITPGKLEEMVAPKLKEFNDVLANQSSTVTQALEDMTNHASTINNQLSNIEKQTNNSVEKVETTTNTIIKEILADKTENSVNKTEDRKFSLIQTAISMGIPSIVFGWVAWLWRRHVGGAIPSPFPQTPPKMK